FIASFVVVILLLSSGAMLMSRNRPDPSLDPSRIGNGSTSINSSAPAANAPANAANATQAPSGAQANAAAPADDWQARFNAVYNLKDGEDLKLIPPPFIPERLAYYRSVQPTPIPGLASDPSSFIFNWTDNQLTFSTMSFSPDRRASLANVLEAV